MVRYRIIKIKDVCPWQVQKRFCLFWWKNVCLSFSSIKTAGDHLSELTAKDAFLSKNNKYPNKSLACDCQGIVGDNGNCSGSCDPH